MSGTITQQFPPVKTWLQYSYICSFHSDVRDVMCSKFKNTFRAPAISVSSQNTKHTRTLYTSYAPSAPLKQNFFICEPFVSRLNVAKQRGKLIFFAHSSGEMRRSKHSAKCCQSLGQLNCVFLTTFHFAFMPIE